MPRRRHTVRACALACLLALPASSHADITWNITYLDNGTGFGFNDPNFGLGRRQAVNAVTSYLNSVLDETGTVDFTFNVSLTTGTGALATSGPRYSGTPAGFQNGHLFSHATTNIDPDPANPDATAQVNFGFTWNNSTALPQPFEVDLPSVLLHEFTHSLGVLSRIGSNGQSNVSGSDPGVYTVYNSFLRTGNTNTATPLFGPGGDYLGSPQDLINPTPGIYFWGPAAVAANGNKPVRVFVQPNFNGSSISHLSASSVMIFPTSAGVVRRKYTPIDLAVLKDLGWKIKPQPPFQLGPTDFKILTLNPSASGSSPNSPDLNDPTLPASGILAGLEIDDESPPRRLFTEDPLTARPPIPPTPGGSGQPTGPGTLTQLSHPQAPNAIALLADDARETAIGLTWFALADNLAIPVAADMATRYNISINPNVRPIAAPGTFTDITFGTLLPGLPGAAPATPGIGLRLHATGPLAGQFQLFDGTSGQTLLETTTPFTSPLDPSTSRYFDITLELLGATFDSSTPELINLYLGGQLVYSFTTDAGLPANYLTFYAGPTAPSPLGIPPTQPALYAFSNLDLSVSQIPEPTSLALLTPLFFSLLRRRRPTHSPVSFRYT